MFRTGSADLSLLPEPGRDEPRLWVKRMIIWRDRDEVLRDITLRPGLNVIWSPDAATDGVSIGHGGGKTTFCRLLRYCLGEDSFAPLGQRRATFDRMPNGRVGAEIRLAGKGWVVIRAFNSFHNDWAIPDGCLDDAFALSQPTGMEAFRSAVTEAILGEAAQLMPSSIGHAGAWPAVLAWLTRDQECRFSHLLDWRDKDSDSQSPVRGRSIADRLTVVRAVLGALLPEELAAERAKEAQADVLKGSGANLARMDWRAQDWRRELAHELGFDQSQPISDLDVATLVQAAEAGAAKASGVAMEVSAAAIQSAREEHDRLSKTWRIAERAVDRASIEAEGKERTVKLLLDELPELSARAQARLLCPICHVPIDHARAEGCGLSLQSCDTEALQAQFANTKMAYEQERAEAAGIRSALPGLKANLAVAEQQRAGQRHALDALLNAALGRTAELRRAQRLLDDARRYGRMLSAREQVSGEIERGEVELERLGALVDKHRRGVSDFVRALSERCDLVARYLVPGEVQARTTLDGNGLQLHIEMGGDRTTAAIESLKVVIFDLAVLTLSIEGRTRFPGFLVHDSPREADLDLAVYHRLFDLTRDLEQVGSAPLFQYIVTTTTTPPTAIADGKWRRLTLHGAPAVERLLGMDL
jgi:hypothetical protein